MLSTSPNIAITLTHLASDGAIGLYSQAVVYNSSNSPVDTVNLNHVAGGLYTANYTQATEGFYSLVFTFYTDLARTIPADYDIQGELLEVNSWRTNILRLLGLLHENTVVDQTTYDSDGNLLTARIRTYNNSTNAAAALAVSPATYNTGLTFEYSVSASYAAGLMSKYNIQRIT